MTTDAQTTTIAQILKSGADYLAKRDVECPDSVMKLLLCRLLCCKPLELMTRGEEALPAKYLDALRRGLKRAGEHEPVQHITGEVDFMGHSIKSDGRALIPRPETELLVDAVLKNEALWAEESPLIIDFGTGSGCIAIAIAKAQPSARILALDISQDALALARENAKANGVAARISFAAEELAELVEPESVDAIVSNPPYIPSADCETLPRVVRDFDPRLALDGGPSGLDVIKVLVTDASCALKSGGSLTMEIGSGQGPDVKEMLEQAGFIEVTVTPDFAGHDRIVHGVFAG